MNVAVVETVVDTIVDTADDVAKNEESNNWVVETSFFRDYGKLRSLKINKGCN